MHGGGGGGSGGAQGGSIFNRMQVKFSPYGQTGDLGVRSKVQIS